MSADDIEQGTHHASYLYARATKAVSLIPAAFYADLACERGRCYLNDFLMEDGDAVASNNGKKGREEERRKVYEAAKKSWGQGVSSFHCSSDTKPMDFSRLGSSRYSRKYVLHLTGPLNSHDNELIP